jgi:hypothetical protein
MGAAQSTIIIPSRRPRTRLAQLDCCPPPPPWINCPPSPLRPPQRRVPVLVPPPCCADDECETLFNFVPPRPPTPMRPRPADQNHQFQTTPSETPHCFVCDVPLRIAAPVMQFLGADGLRVQGQWGRENVDLQIGGRQECSDHCWDCRMYCGVCERGRSHSRPRRRDVRNRTPTPLERRGDGDSDGEMGTNDCRRSSAMRDVDARATAQVPVQNRVYVNVGERISREDVGSRVSQCRGRPDWRAEQAVGQPQRRPREAERVQQERLVCFGDHLCMCFGCAPDI